MSSETETVIFWGHRVFGLFDQGKGHNSLDRVLTELPVARQSMIKPGLSLHLVVCNGER